MQPSPKSRIPYQHERMRQANETSRLPLAHRHRSPYRFAVMKKGAHVLGLLSLMTGLVIGSVAPAHASCAGFTTRACCCHAPTPASSCCDPTEADAGVSPAHACSCEETPAAELKAVSATRAVPAGDELTGVFPPRSPLRTKTPAVVTTRIPHRLLCPPSAPPDPSLLQIWRC